MKKLRLKAYKNKWLVFPFICFLLLPTIILLTQSCENRTSTLKGKKILVFTKNGEGYVHDNIQASVDMFFELGKNEQFSVDTTSNAAIFSSPALQQYDIIVFSNTNNQVFDTQEERDGLVRHVRSGKGFMGVHIACGAEREWAWFKQMLGGTFDFHPPFQEFPVRVVDSLHPSTFGIPSPWIIKEELYVMKEMNPAVHILMVSDFSSPDFIASWGGDSILPMPNTFGKVFPCVWCNTFEGGRQWFTALGHDKSYYTDPLFVRHILGGLEWVAGK
jgi:type 1 glutamine amidotransferase